MKQSIFLSIIVVCISVCSCKKDKTSAPPETFNIQLPSEGLAYVKLPLNRYFIYKDSASGILDSIVVTQSNLETKYEPASAGSGIGGNTKIPAYNYQTFSLLLTKYGSIQEDWFYGQTLDKPVFFSGRPLFDTIALSLVERVRTTNADLGQAFSFSLQTSSAGTIIPTLVIEGKTYMNVFLYPDWNGLDETNANYRRSFYYWVKNLGIVKRTIQTFAKTKTYTLVRNN